MFYWPGKNIKKLSDEDLILKYKKFEKEEIWGELFKRYATLVYGVCLEYLKNTSESEDATMHLFENLPGHLVKYDIKNFKSWLYRCTKNYCYQLYKKNEKFKTTSIIDLESSIECVSEHTSVSEEDEVFDKLKIALKGLDEAQKRCLEMFYYEDKSYKEIVSETGYQMSKVKSYIQNGKRNLKNYIENS